MTHIAFGSADPDSGPEVDTLDRAADLSPRRHREVVVMAERISTGKKILFYLVMVSIPLFFFEAVLRVYFSVRVGPSVLLYGTPVSRHQARFDPKGANLRAAQTDSTVALHLNEVGDYSKYFPNQTRSDRDELDNPIRVHINSHGFRGKEFQLQKQPGVIRIVTLGASSTFGFRNHDEQTYPAQLEQMLNTSAASSSELRQQRIRFEVINLGIPHLRSGQVLSLLRNEALALRPDYVTFYEGVNDAAWTDAALTTVEKTKESVKQFTVVRDVYRELRYRLLAIAFLGSLISPEGKQQVNAVEIESLRKGKAELFISNLQDMYESCERSGIKFVVASQQATSREGRGEGRASVQGQTYDSEQTLVREKLAARGSVTTVEAFFLIHRELMEAQRKWAVSKNIPYVDVISAMDLNRQYLVSWVHLNAKGNEIVASAFSRAILRDLSTKVQ
jgi:lysophospholipase L1-like esterase